MRSVVVVETSLFTDKLMHSHRQMYGALLSFADAKGVCWPTIAGLAAYLKVDGRHVRTVTAQMAALGIIARKKMKNGRWWYRLLKYFVPPRNKPRRDSESAKGVAKKDSERSASSTESVAARARDSRSDPNPRKRSAPRVPAAKSPSLKAKIVQQLDQKLVRFARSAIGREEAARVLDGLMSDDPGVVKQTRDHYDGLMKRVWHWDDMAHWHAVQKAPLTALREHEEAKHQAADAAGVPVLPERLEQRRPTIFDGEPLPPLADVTLHAASADRAAELCARLPAPPMTRSVYIGHTAAELMALADGGSDGT